MIKRILVVEDQEDLRAILRDFLAASGYAVIEAIDGRSLTKQFLWTDRAATPLIR